MQVIGERWSSRSLELRDNFARNRIPIGFYDVGYRKRAQLLREFRANAAELPVVVIRFGGQRTALANPSNLEIAEAFGLMTPIPGGEVFDVAVVGAARPGWPRRSTPLPKACERWSSSGKPSAGRPGPRR